jgi:hypothetical protein
MSSKEGKETLKKIEDSNGPVNTTFHAILANQRKMLDSIKSMDDSLKSLNEKFQLLIDLKKAKIAARNPKPKEDATKVEDAVSSINSTKDTVEAANLDDTKLVAAGIDQEPDPFTPEENDQKSRHDDSIAAASFKSESINNTTAQYTETNLLVFRSSSTILKVSEPSKSLASNTIRIVQVTLTYKIFSLMINNGPVIFDPGGILLFAVSGSIWCMLLVLKALAKKICRRVIDELIFLREYNWPSPRLFVEVLSLLHFTSLQVLSPLEYISVVAKEPPYLLWSYLVYAFCIYSCATLLVQLYIRIASTLTKYHIQCIKNAMHLFQNEHLTYDTHCNILYSINYQYMPYVIADSKLETLNILLAQISLHLLAYIVLLSHTYVNIYTIMLYVNYRVRLRILL